MRTIQPIPQEPFLHAIQEAQDQMHARCKHCPLPPTVAQVLEWDPELWLQIWGDAAGAARRRAGFALNDGLTEEAGRGYWLAAFLYRTAVRFLDPAEGDPRYTLLTTGEAACQRMSAMINGVGSERNDEKPAPVA